MISDLEQTTPPPIGMMELVVVVGCAILITAIMLDTWRKQ